MSIIAESLYRDSIVIVSHVSWLYRIVRYPAIPTPSGIYINAGLSINPRGPALWNVTSHCGENQNGRPSETDLF